MDILIKRIRLDGGTQQRDLDPDVVKHYADLQREGCIFPPVILICDGKNFWAVDGFHRIAAALALGKRQISAEVQTGNQNDAIWASFGANKTHGLRREPGIIRKILSQILNSDQWSTTSQQVIADHVGCTRQMVSKVQAELSEAAKIEQELEPEPEEEIKEQAKKTTKKKTKKTNTDNVGQEIPAEQDVFERGSALIHFAKQLEKARSNIEKAVADDPEIWSRANVTDCMATLKKLASNVRLGRPYAVCVYCGGTTNKKKCQNCKGLGWLSKLQWTAVPEELKP